MRDIGQGGVRGTGIGKEKKHGNEKTDPSPRKRNEKHHDDEGKTDYHSEARNQKVRARKARSQLVPGPAPGERSQNASGNSQRAEDHVDLGQIGLPPVFINVTRRPESQATDGKSHGR